MTEKELRNLAIEKLRAEHYPARINVWFPIGHREFKQDVFGVFDLLVATEGGVISFYQLTTTPNLAARRKKVHELWCAYPIDNAWIWAYNVKKSEWVKERVNGF